MLAAKSRRGVDDDGKDVERQRIRGARRVESRHNGMHQKNKRQTSERHMEKEGTEQKHRKREEQRDRRQTEGVKERGER